MTVMIFRHLSTVGALAKRVGRSIGYVQNHPANGAAATQVGSCIRRWAAFSLVAVIMLCGCQSQTAQARGEKARRADDAAEMVGVNTHINYRGSVYDTRYQDIIKPRLLELGVRHIRDNPGGPQDIGIKQRFVELRTAGIKLLLINWQLSDLQYVKSLNAMAGMKVVEAVEPPNERDVSGNQWEGKLRSLMLRMYPAYKNDPSTSYIKVLGPSFADTRSGPGRFAAVMPNAGDYLDAGNLHNYSGVSPSSDLAGGWGMSLPEALGRYRSVAGAKALQVTENGYIMSGAHQGFPSVPQRAAAKYMPRQFLMHLRNNIRRYYVYELIDVGGDYAILNHDGSPRQQFTAIKNFISLFKDPGPAFTPGFLDFQMTGDLTNVMHTVLQKRDGRFYLIVWQGVPSASGVTDATAHNLEPPARILTLQLGQKFRQAKLYEPTFSMNPIGTYADANGVQSIPLPVPDHILVVELTQ